MDRVLQVTTGNRTNNHEQAVVECTHIHKADDDEKRDKVGEAVAKHQLHVSIMGRAYVKNATTRMIQRQMYRQRRLSSILR